MTRNDIDKVETTLKRLKPDLFVEKTIRIKDKIFKCGDAVEVTLFCEEFDTNSEQKHVAIDIWSGTINSIDDFNFCIGGDSSSYLIQNYQVLDIKSVKEMIENVR
jgi:hypothetical protein